MSSQSLAMKLAWSKVLSSGGQSTSVNEEPPSEEIGCVAFMYF